MWLDLVDSSLRANPEVLLNRWHSSSSRRSGRSKRGVFLQMFDQLFLALPGHHMRQRRRPWIVKFAGEGGQDVYVPPLLVM